MVIRWTQRATNDLTRICDYLAQHGNFTSRRVALTIYRRTNSLQKFPNRGRSGRVAGTRELILTNLPYIIVYKVRQDTVQIVRILPGAQVWPERDFSVIAGGV